MSEPIVAVGEDSRFTARAPIHRQLEKLEHEKATLVNRKAEIENEFSMIEGWRREQLQSILARERLGRQSSEAVRKTNQLSIEVADKKRPLLIEKAAIEKRLLEIRPRIGEIRHKPNEQRPEMAPILLRIESLLVLIAEKLGA